MRWIAEKNKRKDSVQLLDVRFAMKKGVAPPRPE